MTSVKLDLYENVVILHRGEHVWNSDSFDSQTNIYNQKGFGPIVVPTILTLDRTTGCIIREWGKDLFNIGNKID